MNKPLLTFLLLCLSIGVTTPIDLHAQTRAIRLTIKTDFNQADGSGTPLLGKEDLITYCTARSRPQGSQPGNPGNCHEPTVWWNVDTYVQRLAQDPNNPNNWVIEINLDNYFGSDYFYEQFGTCDFPLEPTDTVYFMTVQIRTNDGSASAQDIILEDMDTPNPRVRMQNSSGSLVLWDGLMVDFIDQPETLDLAIVNTVPPEVLQYSQLPQKHNPILRFSESPEVLGQNNSALMAKTPEIFLSKMDASGDTVIHPNRLVYRRTNPVGGRAIGDWPAYKNDLFSNVSASFEFDPGHIDERFNPFNFEPANYEDTLWDLGGLPGLHTLNYEIKGVAYVSTANDVDLTSYAEESSYPDVDQTNNVFSYSYLISDTVLARDNGQLKDAASVFFNTGGPLEIGHRMTLYEDDQLSSISAYLAQPPQGTSIQGKIYTWENGQPGQLLASTTLHSVSDVESGAVPGVWLTLPFSTPTALEAGTYFLVLEQTTNQPMNLGYSQSTLGTYKAGTIFYRAGGIWNEIGTLGSIYQDISLMLRGNFGLPLAPASYCPSNPIWPTRNVYISRVALDTTRESIITESAGICTGYTDNSHQVVTASHGDIIQGTLTLNSCGPTYSTAPNGSTINYAYKIFVDWNGDSTFDINEAVYTDTLAGLGTGNFYLNVPSYAKMNQDLKLRVVAKLLEFNRDQNVYACSEPDYRWGETEDYTIRVEYCKPSGQSSQVKTYISSMELFGPTGDAIYNPSFNTCAAYSDHSNLVLDVTPGGEVNGIMNINACNTWPNNNVAYGIFVDWNGDGVFSYDEEVYEGFLTGPDVIYFYFEIPAEGIASGTTKLRVAVSDYSVSSSKLCWNNPSGEIEDYTLRDVQKEVGITQILTPAEICGSSAAVQVELKNFSDESLTLTNYPVQVSYNNQTLNTTYSGTLASGATTNVTVGSLPNTPGGETYYLIAIAGYPGHAASNPLSYKSKQVTLYQQTPATTTSAERCGEGNLTLSAYADAAYAGTIHWYDASNNLLGLGPEFTTPVISQTTTYTARIGVNNGCPVSAPVTATILPAPAVIVTETAPSCAGEQNGSIVLSPSSGPQPFSYSWNTGSTSNQLSNLTEGTYSVQITDQSSCQSNLSFTLTDPPVLTGTLTATEVSCFGGGDGSLSANISGGTGAYSYNWSGGSPTNLVAGTYSVIVTDANLCNLTLTETITQPQPLQFSSPTITSISCNGRNDGEVVLQGGGGTGPYTYSRDGINYTRNATFTNLGSGPNTFYVKDANQCAYQETYTLPEPAPISFALSVSNPNCAGDGNGSIQVNNLTGGTPTYQFRQNNGSYQASNLFNNLTAGTYQITVQDQAGCTSQQSITLQNPPQLNISGIASSARCFGESNGSVSLNASGGNGGYTYRLGTGSTTSNQTFNNLAAGTYTFYVIDNQQCQQSTNITVSQPDQLTGALTATDVSCNGSNDGSLAADIMGGTPGYTYNWSGGSPTNLSAGTYSVVVTDANQCNLMLTETISEPPVLSFAAPILRDVSCNNGNNGSVTLQGTGGTAPFSYSRDGITYTSNATFNNLDAGSKTFYVKDANDCVYQESYTLNEPTAVSFFLAGSDPLCAGDGNGRIVINNPSGGTPGYQYRQNNQAYQTSNQFNNLAPGTYQITVRDQLGCTSVQSIALQDPPQLTLNATPTPASCYGESNGSVLLTAAGGTPGAGYQFRQGTGFPSTNSTFENLSAQTYTFYVLDDNQCEISTTATINQPDSIGMTLLQSLQAQCNVNNGQLIVAGSGGTGNLEFSIDNGTTWNANGIFPALGAGTYAIRARDAAGCTLDRLYTVESPSSPTLAVQTQADVSCFGRLDGTVTLAANQGTPPYLYSLDNGAQFQTVASFAQLGPGTYQAVVRDASLCQTVLAVVIDQPDLLEPQIDLVQEPLCFDGTDGQVWMSAKGGTPGYQFALPGQAPDTANLLDQLSAGTYQVTVSDHNGCVATLPVVIGQPDLLELTVDRVVGPSCFGRADGLIRVSAQGGTPGYQFALPGQTPDTVSTLDELMAGTYQVTVTDDNGCEAIQTQVVEEPALLEINTSLVDASCIDKSDGRVNFVIEGGTAPYQIVAGADTLTPDNVGELGVGTYSFVVVDQNGCEKPTTDLAIGFQDSIPTAAFSEVVNNRTISFTTLNPTDSLFWDFGDGVFSTEPNPVHTYFSNGSYEVVLVVSNACGSDTFTQVFSVFKTNINPVPGLSLLELYPNPTDKKTTLKVTLTKASPVGIRVYDARGRIVLQADLDKGIAMTQELDLTQAAEGVYQVQVIWETGSIFRKLVVK